MAKLIFRGLSSDSILAAKKARQKALEVAKSDLKYVTKTVYSFDHLVHIKKVRDTVTVTGIPLFGSILMAPAYFPTVDGIANTSDPVRLCVFKGRKLTDADTSARMAGAVQAPGKLVMTPSKSRYFYSDHPYPPVFYRNPYDTNVAVPSSPRYGELLQAVVTNTRYAGWLGKAEFTPLFGGYAIAPGMWATHRILPSFTAFNDPLEWLIHTTSALAFRYR